MPRQTPPDIVYQTWFRMLHLLGNPADMIESMNNSTNASTNDNSLYSQQHIPYCFYLASSAVSKMVDIFHGKIFLINV